MRQLRNQEKQSAHWWSRPFQLRAPVPSPTFRKARVNGNLTPQQSAPASTLTPEAAMDRDSWQVDEHWVAVTSYLAEMDFPNEG